MRPLTSTGHLLLFVRGVPIGICVPIICAKQDFPRDRFQLLNTNAQDGAILLIVREPRGGSAPVTSAISLWLAAACTTNRSGPPGTTASNGKHVIRVSSERPV